MGLSLAQRLNAERPCGCVEGRRFCPQHWDLLTREQREAHIARLTRQPAPKQKRRE